MQRQISNIVTVIETLIQCMFSALMGWTDLSGVQLSLSMIPSRSFDSLSLVPVGGKSSQPRHAFFFNQVSVTEGKYIVYHDDLPHTVSWCKLRPSTLLIWRRALSHFLPTFPYHPRIRSRFQSLPAWSSTIELGSLLRLSASRYCADRN